MECTGLPLWTCQYVAERTNAWKTAIELEKLGTTPTMLKHNPLRWRHNGHDSVSNHQPYHCLLRCRSQKTSKLRVTGLCVENSPETGEFPAQMASNAQDVSIWWRHHAREKLDTPTVSFACRYTDLKYRKKQSWNCVTFIMGTLPYIYLPMF